MCRDSSKQGGVICLAEAQRGIFVFIAANHVPDVPTQHLVQGRQLFNTRRRFEVVHDLNPEILSGGKLFDDGKGFAGF